MFDLFVVKIAGAGGRDVYAVRRGVPLLSRPPAVPEVVRGSEGETEEVRRRGVPVRRTRDTPQLTLGRTESREERRESSARAERGARDGSSLTGEHGRSVGSPRLGS